MVNGIDIKKITKERLKYLNDIISLIDDINQTAFDTGSWQMTNDK